MSAGGANAQLIGFSAEIWLFRVRSGCFFGLAAG